jgi:hypothetical protein
MDIDPDKLRGISRNAPCPCLSGRKFKHCHGTFRSEESLGIPAHVIHVLNRRAKAAEMLRKKQQGYGRPMITAEVDGIRFVQVGKTLAHSRNWKHFPDFLLDNLKRVLRPDWGQEASRSTPGHPIIRWLAALDRARKSTPPGKPLLMRGALAALNRLAYALYQIEHNDKPQDNVLARLRTTSEFDGACYEMIVGSAFAVAGAKIEGKEQVQDGNRKPEFIATFPDGRRYSVEAKRKKGWKNACDLSSPDFHRELQKWIRRMLFESSKKDLDNPVYWFELSIPRGLNNGDMEELRSLIVTAIADAEVITVERQPAKPAYVVVTNFPEFSSDDAPGGNLFSILHGFRMEDMRDGVIDLEEALERHDKQRCVRRVLEAMVEVQMVPNSFAGLPDELLDDTGMPIETLRLGDRFVYPTEDGSESVGMITEVTGGLGDRAIVVVRDEVTGKQVIVGAPLSSREQVAAAKHGDTIFGKPEGPHENVTDPLKIYDSMLAMLADHSHDSLLLQIEKHYRRDEFAKLNRDDLHVRVSREMTKSIVRGLP